MEFDQSENVRDKKGLYNNEGIWKQLQIGQFKERAIGCAETLNSFEMILLDILNLILKCRRG